MNAHLVPNANKAALNVLELREKCYNDFISIEMEGTKTRGCKTRLSKKDKNRMNAIKSYQRRVGLRRV